MENSWCFLCVTTRAGHYKKRAGVLNARVRAGRQQRIRGRSYPRQYSLCHGRRRTPLQAILLGWMEGLPGRKEHLGIFLSRYIPLKDGQHLLQRAPEEADSDISTSGLYSAHGEANDLALRKAKTKATNKIREEKDALRRRAIWGNKEDATRRNPSQYGFRVRSRRIAGDLFSWHRKRWGACSGSLIIGSLTHEELYSTLFYSSLLSSKSLLEQIFYLSTNLGFFFSVFNLGWKVFSLTISTFYGFLVFLSVRFIGWEVFHCLILCPVFLLSFPLG